MEFFIAVLIPVFWIAIGAGITLAVVRGIRKRRLKAELNPLAGAADVYNEALIGKTAPQSFESPSKTTKKLSKPRLKSFEQVPSQGPTRRI